MSDVVAARKLLADLPQNDSLKALDEITCWLASVKDTPGFRPDRRMGVIMLLDEAGQPFYTELLRQYLAAPPLHDPLGMHKWQGARGFMGVLTEAYAVCVDEYQRVEKKSLHHKEQMPVICSRLLRAVAEQMKLDMMRYLDVAQDIWDQLYAHYNFAEASLFADTMVRAYPSQAINTSPKHELLRAIILYISSPATQAPEQIQTSHHISARMVNHFSFKKAPDPDCPYFINLSKPAAPARMVDNIQPTRDMRFIGAVGALPKIDGMVRQNEMESIEQNHHFGNELIPDAKPAVLNHLSMYWGRVPPRRLLERKSISVSVEVAHGFKIISKLAEHHETGQVACLPEAETCKPNEWSKISLIEDETGFPRESWDIVNMSVGGIGGIVPKATGSWVKIGVLCGIKAKNSNVWWVGMIRRLRADSHGKVYAGIKILSKKPMSVRLRILGKDSERIPHWENSTGAFTYDYQSAIVLPDSQNTHENSTMLMEAGVYAVGRIYEALLGEISRHIEITGLLAEGEDYEQLSFKWLAA